jgi:DNA-binding NarL/FixJ family response regulator
VSPESRDSDAVRTRCVVADDHSAILDAVSRFIDGHEELELVGRASDGERALRLISQSLANVALLDVRMPGLTGVEVTRRLCAIGARTAVVLYTGDADRALLLESLDAGARGFLLKEAPLDDLLRAVRVVAAGGTYVDPVPRLLLMFAARCRLERRPEDHLPPGRRLTVRKAAGGGAWDDRPHG